MSPERPGDLPPNYSQPRFWGAKVRSILAWGKGSHPSSWGGVWVDWLVMRNPNSLSEAHRHFYFWLYMLDELSRVLSVV